MQRVSIATSDVPEEDRFSFWREHVAESIIGCTGERSDTQTLPFSGEVVARLGANLAHFSYRSDGFPVTRGAREIARHGWADWIWLAQERGDDGVRLRQDGGEHIIERDDLMIVDPTIALATEPKRNYNIGIWLFPRRFLEPHLPNVAFPRSLRLSGTHGMNRVINGYLNSFATELDSLADAEVDSVTETACRLIAVACGAATGEHRPALRDSRFHEAKRYIALHLADPALTPERVAAALKMSVRRLHLLFEPAGTSFARYVLQRRLEECRLALTGPAGHDRAITDIALAWGFNSLATFYRTFRQTFGATPSEIRAAARPDEE